MPLGTHSNHLRPLCQATKEKPSQGSHFRVTLESVVPLVYRITLDRGEINDGKIGFHCNQYHWHFYGCLGLLGRGRLNLRVSVMLSEDSFRGGETQNLNIFFGKGKGF